MFKSVMTLFRGVSYEVAENVADKNAMTILKQQIRDGAEALAQAKKSVAIAMAQHEKQKSQQDKLSSKIEDLEHRAIEALNSDKDDLAREAAEAIAILEGERDACSESCETYRKEIERLKSVIRKSESRLRDLKRGQQIADASAKSLRLRDTAPNNGLNTLLEAEETLERLRVRQTEHETVSEILDSDVFGTDPEKTAQKLSEAGCGKPHQSTTDQVLERLKAKSSTAE